MSEREYTLYIDGKAVKVSEEVYREFYRGERKERYFMKDLKTEKMVVDLESQTVRFLPSREDSYERLLDANEQFAASGEPVADAIIWAQLLEKLWEALHSLSDDDLKLIEELFFLEKTEREVGTMLNLTHSAISKRKKKILEQLKNFME